MTKWVPPGEEIEAAVATQPLPEPRVFVRTFSTPPGLPWDQGRAARLEARHGAPLPIADLLHQHRRMEAWGPGRAGQFAVFYVRRSDFRGPFETTVDVDGRPVRVAFGKAPGQLKRLERLGRVGGWVLGAAAAVAVAGAGVASALSARAGAEQELTNLEQQAAGKLRQARRLEDDELRARALARIQQTSATPAEVLADLGWLARRRSADARIVAVHWEGGAMAIEARGRKAPVDVVVGGGIVRSEKPIGPGVWLWGVDPRRAPAPAAASEEP